ncbi:MAG TPA: FecR domain-containing protein, partial [Chitinophagaceae bacterium]|nr:FecR domain-containing protein [Chitinophagaceae bacterium]
MTGNLTGSQQQEFFRLLEEEPNRKILEDLMKEEWAQPTTGELQNDDLQNKIEAVVMERIRMQEPSSGPVTMNRRRIGWSLKLAAAAVVLLVISFAAVRLFSPNRQQLAKLPEKSQMINDVLPGGDKAILTLDDGRKIILDTASNGELMVQGGTRLIKEGARVRYDKEAEAEKVYYNTISTPRGGQYRLELADGTKVWLNAASSLRFPSSFLGNDRQVELTGEGYFEVAHDASKPFHVRVNNMDVQVLGTHFNINSYADEPSVKTTLLEGRLKVKDGANYVFLNPGQQAIVAGENQSIRIRNSIDLDEVVAWKNGKFEFNNSTVETVMRQ